MAKILDGKFSSLLARQKWIAVNIEQASFGFPPGSFEGVGRRTDLDFDEARLFEHFLPARARQAAGDSSGPQVDIANGRLGDRLAVCDIGELQTAAGFEHAKNLCEYATLVGA
jgi:hypothetical protein